MQDLQDREVFFTPERRLKLLHPYRLTHAVSRGLGLKVQFHHSLVCSHWSFPLTFQLILDPAMFVGASSFPIFVIGTKSLAFPMGCIGFLHHTHFSYLFTTSILYQPTFFRARLDTWNTDVLGTFKIPVTKFTTFEACTWFFFLFDG